MHVRLFSVTLYITYGQNITGVPFLIEVKWIFFCIFKGELRFPTESTVKDHPVFPSLENHNHDLLDSFGHRSAISLARDKTVYADGLPFSKPLYNTL